MANIKNAIAGNRMQGLPGVDAWTSSGIAKLPKEPPKSVTLRRIVRVGENNDLLNEVANSGDRLRDSIRPYALGVNPMVAVQFNNANSSVQTSLPYKLSSNFRPPIMRQEETLPLSRQHRKTVEITINSVVNSNTEPFYFHKPLKETLPVEGLQIPSASKSKKEVVTKGYKIRLGDRVQPEERKKVETRRVIFENPRVIVVEDVLKVDPHTALNLKKVSVPSDSDTLILNKTPIHSEIVAKKSSSAGVYRVEPKNFKMNNPVRIPEIKTQVKPFSKDNLNRTTQPRMRDTVSIGTREKVVVEKVALEWPDLVLEAKFPVVSVDSPKHGANTLEKNVATPTSGMVDRPLSLQNFLHNR
jgi:hypothetical protein